MTTTKRATVNYFTRSGVDLAALEPFRTSGSLRGERTNGYPVYAGRLYDEFLPNLRADEPDYVVYSYSTPIAWHGSRGWVMPDQRYSVTTSKQQGKIATALAMAGLEVLPS